MQPPRPAKQPIPRELVERYVAGDRVAFRQLFDRLQRELFFVVRRYFRSPFDQEEALQEVWLHLYRTRAQVDPARTHEFMGWVNRLARNKCIDLLKSRGRHSNEVPVDEIAAMREREAIDLDRAVQLEALDHKRIRRALDDFLARLDHQQREFFRLCFVEERSHTEIGAALSISSRRSKYLKKKMLARLLSSAPLIAIKDQT